MKKKDHFTLKRSFKKVADKDANGSGKTSETPQIAANEAF